MACEQQCLVNSLWILACICPCCSHQICSHYSQPTRKRTFPRFLLEVSLCCHSECNFFCTPWGDNQQHVLVLASPRWEESLDVFNFGGGIEIVQGPWPFWLLWGLSSGGFPGKRGFPALPSHLCGNDPGGTVGCHGAENQQASESGIFLVTAGLFSLESISDKRDPRPG